MPLRSIAFLLYFCGSSVGTFAFPILGVICYIVLYHIFPQTQWWGKPLKFMGIRYSFVIGICLLIGIVLNMNRLKFRNLLHPVEVGMVCVFLTMLLSVYTGVGGWTHNADYTVDKMAKVFVFTFILTHVVTSRHHLWILVIVFVLMAWQLGVDAKNAPSGAFLKNRLDGIGGPDFRESAGLAIHLCAMLPFCAILLLQKNVWLKAVSFFATCYAINAIMLCRARSAFVAAIMVAVMAIWYCPRRYRRWVTVALVLGAIGSFRLSDTWFRERMTTIFSSAEERDQSAGIRLQIWAAAWDMFLEHPMGVGVDQFRWEIRHYSTELKNKRRDAHNSFVLCVGEIGIPGLVAYLATLAMSWATLSRAHRRIKRDLAEPAFLELMVFANRLVLLVFILSGLFVSRFYTEAAWWFMALPVCIARTVENEIRAGDVVEEPVLALRPARRLGRQALPITS